MRSTKPTNEGTRLINLMEEIYLDKLILAQLLKKYPEGSQEPATRSDRESDESCSHPHRNFLRFIIILSTHPRLGFASVSSFQVCQLNLLMHSPLLQCGTAGLCLTTTRS
jgi:hypothetical protein